MAAASILEVDDLQLLTSQPTAQKRQCDSPSFQPFFDTLMPKRSIKAFGISKPAMHALPRYHYHIFDRFYLAVSTDVNAEIPYDSRFTYFSVDGVVSYMPFADDFGPLDLEMIHEFCAIMNKQLGSNQDRPIALRGGTDHESATNTVFLVGAYMIIIMHMDLDDVKRILKHLNFHVIPFRDVSSDSQSFDLCMKDCWAGLRKAKELGWIDFSTSGFDALEYAHYASPLNADLHEIVPGKFLAMRGPQQTSNGETWEDVYSDNGLFDHRIFSPKHYAEILRNFEVQAIVRLNEPKYPAQDFRDAGLPVADLFFQDGTPPPPDVVAKFMMIAEGLPGPIAVHCHAGLGRTGTLIALYMMAHYDFTAREAIGWLRIVRPGSVFGPQQAYLCDKEAVMRRTGEAFRRVGPACLLKGKDAGAVEELIAEAVGTVDERLRVIKSGRRRRRNSDRRPCSDYGTGAPN